ncbi:hypothetical protein PUNSTDRAFT_140973 [Punctularia strigosozonata HHB-11173 SS5]|uniref:uncharacterized protein n=1 Tax=Punctularia strigosozonata (strain HHB-11173) TaxID=741275 RepID=UPI00044173E3|nr:uncharacterized protein PUNSTDRAFT_140973 [Punctularia strigosozonata HHB-11173 SS5]EIN12127.1 hypothetical protein PUNSTDRAFT_140973 [Punctularia strigosozonata HHB-11173 SS5]
MSRSSRDVSPEQTHDSPSRPPRSPAAHSRSESNRRPRSLPPDYPAPPTTPPFPVSSLPLPEGTHLLVTSVSEDPPPPYPTPRRPRRVRRQHQQRRPSDHSQQSFPIDVTETSPLLPGSRRTRGRRQLLRTRTLSESSAAPSTALSVARSVYSFFSTDIDSDSESEETERHQALGEAASALARVDAPEDAPPLPASENTSRTLKKCGIRKYFKPLIRATYWKAIFHLLVLNFPYALIAWIYLFVGTLAGTTLLMALPLGAVLCFFNLLGARAFARGEIALQTTFHGPLPYLLPPPIPIFSRPRTRELTTEELEAGRMRNGARRIDDLDSDEIGYEGGFYKNTYAMFTDPTSYHALFYFLVIKPAITLILTVLVLVLLPTCGALILPLPAFMRAIRRVGMWQAGVAVEGLCLGVS